MTINRVFVPSKLNQLADLEFTSENIHVLKAILDNLDPKLLKFINSTSSNSLGSYTKEL